MSIIISYDLYVFFDYHLNFHLVWMLAGLAWLGGLISMISESLGELLTTMRVGPIVVGPRIDEKLVDIPEGRKHFPPE